jgi:predicted DNA-binding transcriptional regulator YafY
MPIHRAIRSGQCPTTADLAALKNVERSERTIKRDLQALREMGAPLYFDRERRGWRYRDPGWEMPFGRMTEGDLLAFFTAERTLQATGHSPEAEQMRRSLARLAALLPEEVTVSLSAFGETISSESAPYVAVDAALLNRLARAAALCRTVEFDYYTQSRDEHNHRRVDVLLLHNLAGDWYAVGWDHLRRDYRDFHVGRVSRLRETGDYFEPPPGWNKDDYLRRGFQMMRGGRLTRVRIVFDAYQARWIRERDKFHPEERREELEGGELRLSFPVGRNGLDAVARFCLTYAGHCLVEAPAALRRMVVDRLQTALKQHQQP